MIGQTRVSSVGAVASSNVDPNIVKGVNIQKRSKPLDQPKLMNRTQVDDYHQPLSNRGAPDNSNGSRPSRVAEMRNSMVENMAGRPLEARRDSASQSIPSSRNFKQN